MKTIAEETPGFHPLMAEHLQTIQNARNAWIKDGLQKIHQVRWTYVKVAEFQRRDSGHPCPIRVRLEFRLDYETGRLMAWLIETAHPYYKDGEIEVLHMVGSTDLESIVRKWHKAREADAELKLRHAPEVYTTYFHPTTLRAVVVDGKTPIGMV